MLLQELRLTSFKNHESARFKFDGNPIIFCGPNGAGKTNILDAIYLLCMTRSYFQAAEVNNIRHEDPFYTVFGRFQFESDEAEVACMFKRQGGKTFRWNKEDYSRLSEHIGKLPVVMIAPGDIRLINEYSEERRRFMDGLIAQTDAEYLQALIRYNKAMEQRNQLLKQSFESGFLDKHLLDSYDKIMTPAADLIKERRTAFIQAFQPYFVEHYRLLSQGKELATINYQPGFEGGFSSALGSSRSEDARAGRTTQGPHKDDLEFELDGKAIKKFGSQGQIKSYLIALKLAQFDLLKERIGKKPTLLLDDIFEKLDEHRAERLLQLVAEDHFGQIFITDTHKDRVLPIFEAIGKQAQLIEIE